MKSLLLALAIFPILAGPAWAGGGQQTFGGIELDPGVRDETFTSRTLSFTALDGVPALGVGISINFEFEVDEQLSFTDTGSDGFDIILRLEYSATPGFISGIPDATISLDFFNQLSSDSNGSSSIIDGNAALFTAHFDHFDDLFFNRLNWFVNDPFISGGTITGATIEFRATGPGGSFEVTTPQAPGAVLVDAFTGTDSESFPLEDERAEDLTRDSTLEAPFTHSVAYQRETEVNLSSGTLISAIADTSGSGSMDFIVAPASTGTFGLNYAMGRHDITHGGINDQLVIDVTGLTSIEVTLGDPMGTLVATRPVVNGRVVIPLTVGAFDFSSNPTFDFARVDGIIVATPSAVPTGTYTIEQIAVTSSSGPQVLRIEPDSTGPVTDAGGMNYTVLFSEAVTGFNNIFDIDATTTDIAGSVIPASIQTSDGITHTFTIRPSVVDGAPFGTVVLAIDPAGGIIDAANRPLIGPTPEADLVTFSANAYQLWAADRGLTAGVNFAYFQDPDRDGKINGGEFLRDTDPLESNDLQREFFHFTEIEGVTYGALTIASRADATYEPISGTWWQEDFSSSDFGFLIDMADNIRGSDDLSFDRFTGPALTVEADVDAPVGQPELDPGWTWFRFRFVDPVGTLDKGFIQTEFEDLE